MTFPTDKTGTTQRPAEALGPVVIAGTGLAGYTVARELRRAGYTDELVMLSNDDGGFYSKPMLSNAFAAGKTAEALLMSSAVKMAETLKATIKANSPISDIDTDARLLFTASGAQPYRALVLALGADPIRLPIEGEGAASILSVNDLDDYARFRKQLESTPGAKRIVLLGGGLIGCEFANDLANAGHLVSVVDPSPTPLGRLVPEIIGEAMRDALHAEGVQWQLGTTATKVLIAPGEGFVACLANGDRIEADVVLSAVGLVPRTKLAVNTGLRIGRAILVNDHLQTSSPDIYALGDCAEVDGIWRPFVLPITHAAKALAQTLAGTPTAVRFPPMPVVVKTPALPLVVCPPAAGSAGQWHIEHPGGGSIEARFVDPAGTLCGFALSGEATSKKQGLQRELVSEPCQ